MSADQRLTELQLELPPAPKPMGVYRPIIILGDIAYLSGHGPLLPDGTLMTGRVGDEIDQSAGYRAARQTGLAILATLTAALGSLDRVAQTVKLLGMVNCIPGFTSAAGRDQRLQRADDRSLRRAARRGSAQRGWRRGAAQSHDGRDRSHLSIDRGVAVAPAGKNNRRLRENSGHKATGLASGQTPPTVRRNICRRFRIASLMHLRRGMRTTAIRFLRQMMD